MSAMEAMFKLRERLERVKKLLATTERDVRDLQNIVLDMEDSLDILSKEAEDE